MIVAKTITQIRDELAKIGAQKIAFVPTMGSLHKGHLELVKEAKKHAQIVVVSIFVNKAQFNDESDYVNYPRNIEQDLELLKDTGATHLFAPQSDEMLPADLTYKIVPNSLVNCLCGSTRVGHFDGVALILSKFFNIIKPDIAIFGKKDFQQYLIVKKLIKDLNFNISLIGVDSIREESGLVMSSRNARLNQEQKTLAAKIIVILNEIRNSCLEQPNKVLVILESYKDKLRNIGFGKIDYLEIRKEEDLSLVESLNGSANSRLFIAVYIGQIRLIDNIPI